MALGLEDRGYGTLKPGKQTDVVVGIAPAPGRRSPVNDVEASIYFFLRERAM